MAIFAYIRVSTDGKGQTTDNQRKLITDAGFTSAKFFSEDGVSGSIKATERPAFKAMLSEMAAGDTLVLTMVDRLGRSASDILNVIEEFKRMKVSVKVMQFDGLDITGSMGKMVLTCMAAMAELERNILIERTKAGMERTRAAGTKIGAPFTIKPEVMKQLIELKAKGETLDRLSALYQIPRNTIARNVTRWKDSFDSYQSEWNARQSQYAAAKAA